MWNIIWEGKKEEKQNNLYLDQLVWILEHFFLESDQGVLFPFKVCLLIFLAWIQSIKARTWFT